MTNQTGTLSLEVGGPLRYLGIAWGAVALGYGISDATLLMGIVAVDTAAGVLLASYKTTLVNATDESPLGVALGLIMIARCGFDELESVHCGPKSE